MWKQCLGYLTEHPPNALHPSSSELGRQGPLAQERGKELWEPPVCTSAQTHVGGAAVGSGPWVQDPRELVLPVREAWNLGGFVLGHAVPLPSPATSLQPTWPDLPVESLLTVDPLTETEGDVLGQRQCTAPCWVLQGPAVSLVLACPSQRRPLPGNARGHLSHRHHLQPPCAHGGDPPGQDGQSGCPGPSQAGSGLPQAQAGTQVLLPTSPGEASGEGLQTLLRSGSPPATRSSRPGQSLDPTARGGTRARGPRWASREESTAHGLSHEPLLTLRHLAPLHALGGPRLQAAQSLRAPAPCCLPAAPTREGCPARGPNATRLEDGSPCWPPCPLGAGRGVGTSRPCLWARSSLPQSLPAALLPCIPGLTCSPKFLPRWRQDVPQRYTAQEFTLSPGLSRPGPQPSGLTQVASAPRGGSSLAQGGSWTAHPTRGRPRAALFGCQTRGNKSSCTSGSRGAGGPWCLERHRRYSPRWWGVFWVSGTLLLRCLSQSLRNASGHRNVICWEGLKIP